MIKKYNKLFDILPSNLLNVYGSKDVVIKGISYDSRKIQNSELFVAMPGSTYDGANYILDAINSGAVAVVTEKDIHLYSSKLEFKSATLVQVSNARRALSEIANKFYNNPSESINIIGVTGTKGKTTTTYFIQSILSCFYGKAFRLGTIEYDLVYKKINPKNTTPESLDLASLLYEVKEHNINWGVMEVSSHALKTYRVEDISFSGAIFTNLSLEHTEFHPTMEDYYQSKKRLFFEIKKINKPIIINIDNHYGLRLYQESKSNGLNVFSVGIENSKADFVASNIVSTNSNQTYLFHNNLDNFMANVNINLLGKFNIYNSLMAAAICYVLGVSWQSIEQGLLNVSKVPGRFEYIPNKLGFNVIVDYAHTPESLENILKTAREISTNRVLVVFGCGGNRSREKRPLMGKIAAKNSDIAIITSDNPRKENPDDIIKDIISGVDSLAQIEKQADIVIEPDRKKAIELAIMSAQKGDVVIIAGKGHETGQIFANHTVPFDDREIAADFVKMREGAIQL